MRNNFAVWCAAIAVWASGSTAFAADVLFVSDAQTDTNVIDQLRGAGHTVTVVLDDYETATDTNATLTGDLSGFDAVVWSATGTAFGAPHDASTFVALESYVTAGGFVFVTGGDSIASPTDPNLIAFVGGTSSTDIFGAGAQDPGPIAAVANELTVGFRDIQGQTPTGGDTDRDALRGLAADTVSVVSSATDAANHQWTLRTLGSGRIAWITNGNQSNTIHDPSWEVTAADGSGAYRAALLNFVYNASLRENVLFVADANGDNNIPAVLTAEGHTVTTVINDYDGATDLNATLGGDLSAFDVIVWSANGDGFGALHAAATFANLMPWVMAGGRILVTGGDAIDNPDDPELFGFLGGTGTRDLFSGQTPGEIADVSNCLTNGVVDIRGVTPTGGSPDRDGLLGVGADVEVVATSFDDATEVQWSVRTVGAGFIGWVSNGAFGATTAHPSWADTTAGGAGAYNAAIRNFAACIPEPTLGDLGDACGDASECTSGFCADGVCCDTACGGAADDCQACTAALTGGADGTCGPTLAGTECRASAGACDVAETCDGAGTACPADVVVAADTECRASAGDCDVAEVCDGASGACPADAFAAADTECRAAADLCDAAEVCDGASAACPADALAAAGTECRAAAGDCDTAEVCDGAGAACPADALAAAGTECRAAVDLCDTAEVCDGAAADCPADAVAAAGTVCRMMAGACDLAEVCDGAATACPMDMVVAAGTECRAAADVCDAAEACDGATAACPADTTLPDGMTCSDDMACTGGEVCTAGVCGGGSALDCDDGDVCTADSCAEPDGCANEPIAGCCTADGDCDDGDECTADSCGADNVCVNEAIDGCGDTDAGPGTDAGPDTDAGMDMIDAGPGGDDGGATGDDGGAGVDAGGGSSGGGGCGCTIEGESPDHGALLVPVLLGLVFLRRRRR